MSCQDVARRPEVDVDLPEAAPDAYLRWATWDRRFERTVRRRAGERHRSSSVSWRRDDPSALLGAMLIRDVADEARSAKRSGRRAVAPHLRWHPAMLFNAIDYIDRRRRSAERLALDLGKIPPPGWDVLVLQARVIGRVRTQLFAGGPDHVHERPISGVAGGADHRPRPIHQLRLAS